MLKLPDVTLIALTNKNIPEHEYAIERSCEGIEFGAVKLIVDYKCTSIDEWNRKIIYELWKYVNTSHALLIHADGYVINPELWNPDWLNYDYIGAPWPLPTDDFSYRTPTGELIRVGNSVSLRSKELMQAPWLYNFEWKSYYGNTNEDGFLCVHNKDRLEELGCVFAPIDVAKHFSKEHDLPENVGLKTFAFHSL
jgi:Protein of unknown function (DUF5672)